MTQRKLLSPEGLSEHLICLSEQQRARKNLQKTIPSMISQ